MIPIRPVESAPGPAARGAVAPTPAGVRWLLEAPHRLCFFLGALGVLGAGAWWAAVLAARAAGIAFPLALAPVQLHAALMVHGFMPFFFWGFLFTAGPKWLDVPPPSAASLLPAVLPAALALVAMPVAASLSPVAVALAALVVAAGWFALAARFAALVVASRARDLDHAIAVLAAGGLGAVGAFAFGASLATGDPAIGRASVELGLWGFAAPVFVAVAHRMLPFFTANVLKSIAPWRPRWLLAAMVGGLWLHGLAGLADLPVARAVVDAALGALLGVTSLRWGLLRGLRAQPLLAMLHVGFAWLGAGFSLYALDAVLVRSGGAVAGLAGLGLAPLHAVSIGGFGSLLIAMVTRVTSGHSGRPLVADRTTVALFALFQAAAVLRIAAELQSGAGAATWLSAAAIALWLAVLGGWVLRTLPVWLAPRIDGRPG